MQSKFKRVILLSIFALLISSCTKDIYRERFKEVNIDCLRVENGYRAKTLIDILNSKGVLVTKECPYSLEIEFNNISECNLGAKVPDFDGYIRLSIFENSTELYRCQRDFKLDLRESDLESLVDYIIKDNSILLK